MKSKSIPSKRPLSFTIAALLSAITLTACGQFDSAEVADLESAGGEGGNSGTGAGSGGPAEDIVVQPPAGTGPSMDPLGDLCGTGACDVGVVEAVNKCDGTDVCQLIPVEGTTVAECGPAGKSGEGAVCQNAQNCNAGLGCAATPNGGSVCRSYCCGSPDSCPSKTYCAAQPMAEDTINEEVVQIPVCIPATNCQLLNDATCSDGLTCAIVRNDGTTSCIPPGPGQLNEACPCAAGFVCSKLTDQCKKLCRIGKDAEDCGGSAACQAGSSGFPEGYGVCVGGS